MDCGCLTIEQGHDWKHQAFFRDCDSAIGFTLSAFSDIEVKFESCNFDRTTGTRKSITLTTADGVTIEPEEIQAATAATVSGTTITIPGVDLETLLVVVGDKIVSDVGDSSNVATIESTTELTTNEALPAGTATVEILRPGVFTICLTALQIEELGRGRGTVSIRFRKTSDGFWTKPNKGDFKVV